MLLSKIFEKIANFFIKNNKFSIPCRAKIWKNITYFLSFLTFCSSALTQFWKLKFLNYFFILVDEILAFLKFFYREGIKILKIFSFPSWANFADFSQYFVNDPCRVIFKKFKNLKFFIEKITAYLPPLFVGKNDWEFFLKLPKKIPGTIRVKGSFFGMHSKSTLWKQRKWST